MPTPLDDLVAEVRKISAKVEQFQQQSQWQPAEILAIDKILSTVTIRLISSGQTIKLNATQGTLPDVGTSVNLAMNGTDAIMLPVPGTLAPGNAFQSTDFVSGSTGWQINAAGDAEFNNVVVRGTITASTIQSAQTPMTVNGNAETAFTPVEILPNGNFDTNITGWTGSNATLLRITATPAPQAGSGSMRLTANSAADMAAITPTGTSGFPVTPGDQYLLTCYFRSLVTVRACRPSILFYNAVGTAISSSAYGEQSWAAVNDATGSWTQITSRAFVPPQAAFAAVKLTVIGCANGEQHAVDTVSFKKELTGVGNGAGANNNANQSYVTRDTGTVHAGAASWKVNPSVGGTGTSLLLKVSVPTIVGGNAYVHTAWVRRGGSNDLGLRPFAQWLTSAGTVITQPSWPPPRDTQKKVELVTSTWRQFEFIYTAPQTAVSAVFMFLSDARVDGGSMSAESFFIDDMVVYRDTAMIGGSVLGEFVASNTEVWDQTGNVMPVGTICAWVGNDAFPPDGWLVCGGYTVNILDFPRLYMTMGTTAFEWGVPAAGTFWIPDLRGRVIVGRDNMAGAGASLRQTITHGSGQTNMGYGGDQHFQAHVHDIKELGGYQAGGGIANAFSPGGGYFGSTTNTGGTGGGDNLQPSYVLNYIIKF